VLCAKQKLPPGAEEWPWRFTYPNSSYITCKRAVGHRDVRVTVFSAWGYVAESWTITKTGGKWMCCSPSRICFVRGELLKPGDVLFAGTAVWARMRDHAALLALMAARTLKAGDGDGALAFRVALYLFSHEDWLPQCVPV
jgi:hypothetical protein